MLMLFCNCKMSPFISLPNSTSSTLPHIFPFVFCKSMNCQIPIIFRIDTKCGASSCPTERIRRGQNRNGRSHFHSRSATGRLLIHVPRKREEDEKIGKEIGIQKVGLKRSLLNCLSSSNSNISSKITLFLNILDLFLKHVETFRMSGRNSTLLAGYNPLTDPHLTSHYSSRRRRKHLRSAGLVCSHFGQKSTSSRKGYSLYILVVKIKRNGEIVSDRDFLVSNQMKETKAHMKDLLAQAVVQKETRLNTLIINRTYDMSYNCRTTNSKAT